MKGHFMQIQEIGFNMEEQINRLHNRHLAKLLSQLNEINTPQIIIDTIKKQLSFYTKDIKEQVLTSNFSNHDKSNTK
jgi:hypothetical protein